MFKIATLSIGHFLVFLFPDQILHVASLLRRPVVKRCCIDGINKRERFSPLDLCSSGAWPHGQNARNPLQGHVFNFSCRNAGHFLLQSIEQEPLVNARTVNVQLAPIRKPLRLTTERFLA